MDAPSGNVAVRPGTPQSGHGPPCHDLCPRAAPPPRALRQPHPAGAARQVQALGPRLGLVDAQPAGPDGDLLARLRVLPRRCEPPVGEPSGLHVFAFFLLCGLLPVDLPRQRRHGRDGRRCSPTPTWSRRCGSPASCSSALDRRPASGCRSSSRWACSPSPSCSPATWCSRGSCPVLVVVLIQAAFVLGLALALSVWSVYFRDLEYLVGHRAADLVLRHADRVPGRRWSRTRSDDRPALFRALRAEPDDAVRRGLPRPPLLPAVARRSATMAYLVGCAVGVARSSGWTAFGRLQGRLAEEL